MMETRSVLANEWSLLQASCAANPTEQPDGIRAVFGKPIQWKALFALAEQHGLQPLLYHTLSKIEDRVPAAEMCSLQQIYQTNLLKSLFLSRELIRIVDHLRSAALDVLPYKGPALAEAVYGDIALRPAGDIDLFIRPSELPRIRGAVRELGYVSHSLLSSVEERAFLKSGYEWAFDGPAGPNLLEVQWAIQPHFYAVDYNMDGLFSRALKTMVAGHEVNFPSPEDLFIVLSIHAAKHVWGRLIWLCDIARIMHTSDLNWTWIGSQAVELGVVRILHVTALLANTLVGSSIPTAMEEHLPYDPHAPSLAEEVEKRIISGLASNVQSFDYFRLMVQLRERKSDRVRFITRLAFTPGPSEWACLRLPRPLFPLYRLVRLSRLAAKLVRG